MRNYNQKDNYNQATPTLLERIRESTFGRYVAGFMALGSMLCAASPVQAQSSNTQYNPQSTPAARVERDTNSDGVVAIAPNHYRTKIAQPGVPSLASNNLETTVSKQRSTEPVSSWSYRGHRSTIATIAHSNAASLEAPKTLEQVTADLKNITEILPTIPKDNFSTYTQLYEAFTQEINSLTSNTQNITEGKRPDLQAYVHAWNNYMTAHAKANTRVNGSQLPSKTYLKVDGTRLIRAEVGVRSGKEYKDIISTIDLDGVVQGDILPGMRGIGGTPAPAPAPQPAAETLNGAYARFTIARLKYEKAKRTPDTKDDAPARQNLVEAINNLPNVRNDYDSLLSVRKELIKNTLDMLMAELTPAIDLEPIPGFRTEPAPVPARAPTQPNTASNLQSLVTEYFSHVNDKGYTARRDSGQIQNTANLKLNETDLLSGNYSSIDTFLGSFRQLMTKDTGHESRMRHKDWAEFYEKTKTWTQVNETQATEVMQFLRNIQSNANQYHGSIVQKRNIGLGLLLIYALIPPPPPPPPFPTGLGPIPGIGGPGVGPI